MEIGSKIEINEAVFDLLWDVYPGSCVGQNEGGSAFSLAGDAEGFIISEEHDGSRYRYYLLREDGV